MENENPYAVPQADVEHLVPTESGLPAKRSSRFWAARIDGMAVNLIVLPVDFFVRLPGLNDGSSMGITQMMTSGDFQTKAIAYAFNLTFFLIVFALFNFNLLRTKGQTLGKKAMGIRIVGADGLPVAGKALLLRYAFMYIAPVFLLGKGFILNLIDELLIFRESRQCLHDTVAKTTVVTV